MRPLIVYAPNAEKYFDTPLRPAALNAIRQRIFAEHSRLSAETRLSR
jgi:hypothetical protein